MNEHYDIVIIGGGINGTAIAADAAGRGLKVLLCEAQDLACGTSSASSKLIHGGLRYLEQYQFHLVREALNEREILLKKAPHNIRPLQFIMPNDPSIRSPWLIRLGLFLYDHLGARKKLAGSNMINLERVDEGSLFKNKFKTGFCYSDCWTDDARLVVLNALCAHENGATIKTRTAFKSATREKEIWRIILTNIDKNDDITITSRAIVNAAGPWADEIFSRTLAIEQQRHISLVKGSHIIVPQISTTQNAFILQNEDKRVIFILPYLNQYSLIGTTDVEYQGDLRNIRIEDFEINYLLDGVNRYLKTPLRSSDIIHSYSGVRALAATNNDKLAEMTRNFTLEINDYSGESPLLSVFGGKITTHRVLAEQAINKLLKYFPEIKKTWTANTPLPGGDIPNCDFNIFIENLYQEYSQFDQHLILRYAHQFGTRIHSLLKHTNNPIILGENYGCDLYHIEVDYLIKSEWARTADDILWRRTKLGYSFPKDNFYRLENAIKRIITI